MWIPATWLDDRRHSRTDCIEDDRQAPVNVSENHLASLGPAANVRNDEIPEKFHLPSTYKFQNGSLDLQS